MASTDNINSYLRNLKLKKTVTWFEMSADKQMIFANHQSLPLITLLGKLPGYLSILLRNWIHKFMSDLAHILAINKLQQYFCSFSFGGSDGKNKLFLESRCLGNFVCACVWGECVFFVCFFTDVQANRNNVPVSAGGKQTIFLKMPSYDHM